MRFAYADPPYLGQCLRYGHPHQDGCWNHLATHRGLIDWLIRDFPDGWALSLSSPSLRDILPMTPTEARVAAWGKPYASFKPGVRPSYAWEPVIFVGGRNPSRGYVHVVSPEAAAGALHTPQDFCFAPASRGRGLSGAKPELVCRWILDLLGFRSGEDEIVDIFPGTGVMGGVSRQEVMALADPPGSRDREEQS